MSSLETNKIFAAILLAGLIAMLAGFVANQLVQPTELAKTAYNVPVPKSTGAASAAPAEAKPAPIAPFLAKADPKQGEKIAQVCMACHTFNKGGPAKIGPNLWGIIGAKHAHMAGFDYSDAMKKFPGNWTFEELNQFLFHPQGYVVGTKMPFAGLPKEKDRADVIAWLRTQSDNPEPLPKP